jgi:hypothetical protein
MSYTETHFGKIRILTKNTKDTIKYIKDNDLSKYYNVDDNQNNIDLTDEAVLFLLSVRASTINATPAGPYPSY